MKTVIALIYMAVFIVGLILSLPMTILAIAWEQAGTNLDYMKKFAQEFSIKTK